MSFGHIPEQFPNPFDSYHYIASTLVSNWRLELIHRHEASSGSVLMQKTPQTAFWRQMSRSSRIWIWILLARLLETNAAKLQVARKHI